MPSAAGAPGSSAAPATLASRDEVRGRLVLHHDGYGFVVLDTPSPQLDGDLFIPRSGIEDAMHGDHILAKIQRLGGPALVREGLGPYMVCHAEKPPDIGAAGLDS